MLSSRQILLLMRLVRETKFGLPTIPSVQTVTPKVRIRTLRENEKKKQKVLQIKKKQKQSRSLSISVLCYFYLLRVKSTA